ncbi:tetratricopeptide repeat protein [Gangjinia marincola]
MKTKFITLTLSMLVAVGFAQKKEIKSAGKAISSGDFKEAKASLEAAKAMGADNDEKLKEDYYYYKGQAYYGTGQNVSTEDLMTAAEAYKMAMDAGNDEAQAGIDQVRASLVNGAVEDQKNESYEDAAKKLITSYNLNKQDTIYLYYAASNYINAQDYDNALVYYTELKNLNFNGSETQYTAVNKESGETESFPDKTQRDLMVKSGTYIKPSTETTPSKAGEIAKNIALIYISKDETDKAIAAMEDAKAANPGDANLLQAEADMYYRMEKLDKYAEIMQQIIAADPNNPTLFYNLGVSTAQMGNADKAIEYYQKALELDPAMSNAKINIAAVYLGKEAPIVEEMNGLGNSAKDNKRYDELSKDREDIYKQAAPYLEDYIKDKPDNIEAIRTLMNIYYQIDDPRADELSKKLKEMEGR